MSDRFKELCSERSGSPAPTDEGLKRAWKEICGELKHQLEAGSHEMAAALFRGDAFVMYPHAGQEAEGQGVHGPDHGLPEAAKEPEQPQQDHGGMER